TPKSSGGAPGGKTSGSGKGPKRRFSVGTVLNEGAANEMSKGATLSPEELKAKAGEALEEARRMVKKKNWSQGYQSASVCYEFLMRLPAGAENADVTALKEECTRLLKNCSTHLDTKLPSGDDKAIVIE
ncbi:MAG: hypothetical protein PHQ75_10015, partial [Thermoguttaceae bacterium]|nr:hypothetical protein [Thermoguttaceae bacterium]